jgi:hypothetical protein
MADDHGVEPMVRRARRWRVATAAMVVVALLAAGALAACGSDHAGGPAADQATTATVTTNPATSPTTDSGATATTTSQPSGPPATSPGPETTGPELWTTPSGNIACSTILAADGSFNIARCDISQRSFTPPPKPADCEFGWGGSLQVDATGPAAFACTSDSVFGSPDVLGYGQKVRAGAVVCASEVQGVTCRNDEGHGFFVSAERYVLF